MNVPRSPRAATQSRRVHFTLNVISTSLSDPGKPHKHASSPGGKQTSIPCKTLRKHVSLKPLVLFAASPYSTLSPPPPRPPPPCSRRRCPDSICGYRHRRPTRTGTSVSTSSRGSTPPPWSTTCSRSQGERLKSEAPDGVVLYLISLLPIVFLCFL